MPIYRVFGGLLKSPVDLPELRLDPGAHPGTDWELVLGRLAPLEQPIVLGREQLVAGVSAVLSRDALGRYELAFDDTGRFGIDPSGHTITWEARDDATPELMRSDLIGRVLAVALHIAGDLCLHASAVERGGTAAGFLAPKGFGKTTTALALVLRGARLLTDDSLAIKVPSGLALPGVHAARLTDEGVERYGSLGETRASLSDKSVLDGLPDDRLATRPAELSALYVLAPCDPAEQGVISRELLAGPFAAIAIVQFAKLGSLLGGPAAAEVLDRAAAVVPRVPVYRLQMPRDTGLLDREVGRIEEWIDASGRKEAVNGS